MAWWLLEPEWAALPWAMTCVEVVHAGLHHEDALVLPGGLDNEVAGVEAAGFLVAVKEDTHAALGHEAPALQQPDGEVRHHDAALHVQDARSVGLVPLHTEGHGGESSHREDGVVMPHDQNSLAAAAQLAVQVVAAFRLGDAPHPEAQAAELLFQKVAAAV